jgi:aminopeptidase
LAQYKFTLKTDPPSPFKPGLDGPLSDKVIFESLQPSKGWDRGTVYAKAQNFARTVRGALSLILASLI